MGGTSTALRIGARVNRMLKSNEYGKTASGLKGLSKTWKVEKAHKGVYTGGKVQVSKNGDFAACLLHDDVAILNSETGELIKTLQGEKEEEEKEAILSFCIRPNGKEIATASRNLLIRLWDIETLKCIRTIKAHDTPVLTMDFDPTGTLVATGSSDRTVKVFDIEKGFCTHNFKGHGGIVTTVKFHPNAAKLTLISCSEDTDARVWDLYAQKNVAVLTDHMSVVTAVDFLADDWTLVTVGRDKVMCFWDLRRFKLLKTAPLFESLEGVCVLPPAFQKAQDEEDELAKNEALIATVGAKGALRIWKYTAQKENVSATCRCVCTKELNSTNMQFMHILLNPGSNQLIAVTSEHNFLVIDNTGALLKQIIGYNDQIIALKYIPSGTEEPPSQIVVATNSEELRLMDRETMSSHLLAGHSEIVMAVAVSPDGRWIVSASKDKTCRVWDVKRKMCIASCVGHTEAVAAIGMSRKIANYLSGLGYFVTGSCDKTLKLWSLKALKDVYKKVDDGKVEEIIPINKASTKAHDKDINTIAISPNDRLIASGSQDKTIKFWSAEDLSPVGTCRGHKRGIWAVAFSPVDQCLASSSADKTIKVWSVKDFTCIKTFEGHTASVLNVQFVTAGMQLLSTGADGLVKLWTIKSNECENTFDEHQDKIWALEVSPDQQEMITGGSDSTINIWRDRTEEDESNAIAEREQLVLKEQELFNCLGKTKYQEAVFLAFDLGYPRKLYQILETIVYGPNSQDKVVSTKENPLNSIVAQLDDDQLTKLVSWTRDWNTNAKTSGMAQLIIASLLQCLPQERLLALDQMETILDGLIAYTERHFERLDRLAQKSYLVDYSIVAMRRLLPEALTDEEEDSPVSKRKASIDDIHDKDAKKSRKLIH